MFASRTIRHGGRPSSRTAEIVTGLPEGHPLLPQKSGIQSLIAPKGITTLDPVKSNISKLGAPLPADGARTATSDAYKGSSKCMMFWDSRYTLYFFILLFLAMLGLALYSFLH